MPEHTHPEPRLECDGHIGLSINAGTHGQLDDMPCREQDVTDDNNYDACTRSGVAAHCHTKDGIR